LKTEIHLNTKGTHDSGVIDIDEDLKQQKRVLLSSKRRNELELVKIRVSQSFEQVKEQFEDHLVAINENTNEIQSNFEYLCEMDRKIDKLAEKIEELNLILRQQKGEDTAKKTFELQPLTSKEKEVFYALYVLTEQRRYTTYKDLSKRTCYAESLVASYITNLIEKGIPVVKKYAKRTAYLSLDPEFREIQAKENIVGVNTLLTHWVR
jgi:hypothetical protein